MIWSFARGLLAIFFLILLSRFCHHQTEGFRISKIQRSTFERIGIDQALFTHTEEQQIQRMLSQPFTYLARGKQSFVFLSQDKTIVLKFLNNHYQSKLRALSLLPSFSWQQAQSAYFHRKMQESYQSYLLSFSELHEETGIIFLHLHPSHHLKQKVKIFDKLGIAHEIDLDSSAFIVQQKATLALEQFEEWLLQGNIESVKKGISSLLTLIQLRQAKEIADKDPLIRTNIGFKDTTPLFLDLGPFSKNTFPKSNEAKRVELQKITHSLREWLQKRDPACALFLEEELQRGL